jgi:hypothetical protein
LKNFLLNSTENSIFGSILKNAFSLLILSALRILSVPTVAIAVKRAKRISNARLTPRATRQHHLRGEPGPIPTIACGIKRAGKIRALVFSETYIEHSPK